MIATALFHLTLSDIGSLEVWVALFVGLAIGYYLGGAGVLRAINKELKRP